MSVLTKEEILKKLQSKFGESTDDESISLLEDITDTLTDFESKTKDTTDWETKYKENDEMWKKKYRDRFFAKPVEEHEEETQEEEDDKPITSFDQLFEEVK